MRVVRDKADLIALALPSAPSAACGRAIREGRAILWGVFAFTNQFGWILEIPGRVRRWIVAIEVDEIDREYKVRWLNRIPWVGWSGLASGEPSMTNGDNPVLAAYFRDQEKNNGLATAETYPI